MTDAPLRIWVEIKQAGEFVCANDRMAEIPWDGHTEYHLHTREALAQSPIVQAMIAEAVAECAPAHQSKPDQKTEEAP
jgi:hypothetical protein